MTSRVLAFAGGIALGCGASDDGPAADDSVAAVTGKDGGAATGAKLDVNDVSLLFPLPRTVADRSKLLAITADTGRSGDPLFSEAMFNTISTAAPSSISTHFGTLDEWRILGLRFDPCAKGTNPKAVDCTVELRLIAQPIYDFPAVHSFGAGDHSIHLIYQLAADVGPSVVSELSRLKALNPSVTTNGVPLGVHPVMAKEGLGGPFVAALNGVIKKFAGVSKLRDVAMERNVNGSQWAFVKGTVQRGQLRQVAIPQGTGNLISLRSGFDVDGSPHDASLIDPVGAGPDNANTIVDSSSSDASFFKLSEPDQQKAVDSLFRIENLDVNSPVTVDCVSCHQATRALGRVANVKGAGFTAQFDTNPNRFVPSAGVTATFAPTPGSDRATTNVRMFGYDLNSQPAITRASVNGSAKVAAFINQNMLAGHP